MASDVSRDLRASGTALCTVHEASIPTRQTWSPVAAPLLASGGWLGMLTLLTSDAVQEAGDVRDQPHSVLCHRFLNLGSVNARPPESFQTLCCMEAGCRHTLADGTHRAQGLSFSDRTEATAHTAIVLSSITVMAISHHHHHPL